MDFKSPKTYKGFVHDEQYKNVTDYDTIKVWWKDVLDKYKHHLTKKRIENVQRGVNPRLNEIIRGKNKMRNKRTKLWQLINEQVKKQSNVQTYRKIPVEIQALLFKNNIEQVKTFCGKDNIKVSDDKKEVHIITLQGDMLTKQGDYIIKGVKGQFYPCRADIFKQTYELVEQQKEK